MRKECETEGFYRLLSNEHVSYRGLVACHASKTMERMPLGGCVRVVHDTTELKFSGEVERDGLAKRSKKSKQQVFFAHVAMAMTCDDVARPLGVVGMNCWARTGPRRSSRRLNGPSLAKIKEKESNRWYSMVDEVETLVDDRSRLVHLMDREADSYPLFCAMLDRRCHFVIRMARDRVVFAGDLEAGDDETIRLSEALVDLPHRVSREVPLAGRAKTTIPRLSKGHGPRDARSASLRLSAGMVTLKRPQYYARKDGLPESVALNVVYAHEVDAPTDQDAIAWVLITTEPISTAAEIEAVVDHYRHRWQIEEFFKALKTGCSFEERQLESLKTLTNALALFLPIAWQMLLLRAVSRATPNAPAETVLTSIQIEVLRHYEPEKLPRRGVTAHHALMAVAGLGGHLKRNGPPGWRTHQLRHARTRSDDRRLGSWRTKRRETASRSDQSLDGHGHAYGPRNLGTHPRKVRAIGRENPPYQPAPPKAPGDRTRRDPPRNRRE
jgi:hypothetical protein